MRIWIDTIHGRVLVNRNGKKRQTNAYRVVGNLERGQECVLQNRSERKAIRRQLRTTGDEKVSTR